MRRLIFLLFLFSFNLQIFAQAENVDSIKIVSSWDGLGQPSESRLSIVRKKENFYAGGKKIKTELIDALLSALKPSDKEPDLADFGITQAWLDDHAEKVIGSYTPLQSQAGRTLFIKSFRDLKLIEKVLPSVFGGGWTDDFPHFEMKIKMKDGARITVESSEQSLLMIPWTVKKGADVYQISDPRLSRAIVALLPEKFTNSGRISEIGLAAKLGQRVYFEIENELKLVDTREKIGGELARLENRYEIKETAINYMDSVDVGAPSSEYQTGGYKKFNFPSWNAVLRRKDLPENVLIGVSLPYRDKKLDTFNVFLEKIDAIVERVMSVSWLSKYLAENPNTKIEIRFVTDRSFSEKARESFVESMTEGKAQDFLESIEAALSDSVFVEISQDASLTRWLVLPDKRMILWHYKTPNVLLWDLSKEKSWDRYGWNVTKFVVLPDGTRELP